MAVQTGNSWIEITHYSTRITTLPRISPATMPCGNPGRSLIGSPPVTVFSPIPI
ncbi:MAG: hypothetical protein ACREIP_18105 [Alphaproteobacteria bacterium]